MLSIQNQFGESDYGKTKYSKSALFWIGYMYTTKEMKERLGVKDSRPLADFLPTLTIVAKNLATEMTNYNVEERIYKGSLL